MSGVSSNKNLVFCPPALGKPNPAENKPLDGPDTRTRILQKGQKGPTCGIHIFHFLRDRENAPNTATTPKRQFEKLVSERRKAIGEAYSQIPDLSRQLGQGKVLQQIIDLLKTFTKTNLQTPEPQRILGILDSQPAVKVKISVVLPAFMAQDQASNLMDYLATLPKSNLERLHALNETFILGAKENLDEHVNSLKARLIEHQVLTSTECDEFFNVNNRLAIVNTIIEQITAKRFGYLPSSWKPTSSHEKLIEELQSHGPLIVSGYFGINSYLSPPISQNYMIGGRAVYGWPTGTPRVQAGIGHSIMIVGAAAGLVYYIDPNDESDPNAPEKQRIFVMSYKRLTDPSSIQDIFHLDHAQQGMTSASYSPFDYAYYYPRQTANTAAASSSLPQQLSNLNISNNNNNQS